MSTPSSQRTVRIATRESQLALWQANYLAERLTDLTAAAIELVPVSTIGDRDRSESLREMGGQGVFTREIQKAVLDGRADVAVHSLKDLPTDETPGLILAAVPERAPRYDALILPIGSEIDAFDALPAGTRIGTGSPRRQAQLAHARGDLQLLEIRGNVDTRLRKLDAGEYDAIILAEAGLRRLGLADRISFVLSPPLMLPAVGQAALGIECRSDDVETLALLAGINDGQTMAEVTAERACLSALRAGCHAPVGVECRQIGEELHLTAVVLSPDGQQRFDTESIAPLNQAQTLGQSTAQTLIALGAAAVL